MENLIRSFSWKLWIAFLSSTFLVYFLILISRKLPSDLKETFSGHNFTFGFGMMLVIIFGEGTSKFPIKNSLRILIMSFIVQCIVLRAAYTSEMFQFLQSGSSHKVMSSLAEMEENHLLLLVPFYTEFYVPLKEIKFNQR